MPLALGRRPGVGRTEFLRRRRPRRRRRRGRGRTPCQDEIVWFVVMLRKMGEHFWREGSKFQTHRPDRPVGRRVAVDPGCSVPGWRTRLGLVNDSTSLRRRRPGPAAMPFRGGCSGRIQFLRDFFYYCVYLLSLSSNSSFQQVFNHSLIINHYDLIWIV